MLQDLRDNLKGTVAIIVIIIFIVPLVLFGVDKLFVDSAGSGSSATVNGEEISPIELNRELGFERQRRQQRFKLESNSPQLENSVLVGPVLKRMTRRLALYQAAREGGMGASADVLWRNIAQIEGFHIDGKFDYDLFKERISPLGYTRSTFLQASANDLVLQHVNSGISGSAFVTDQEISLLTAITKQQRSFFSVSIPKSSIGDVTVSDEDALAFYEKNSSSYMSPEEVVVEYVELSLSKLAESVDVSDEDVKSAFDQEVLDFVADPKYTVAHLLLKTEEGRDAKIAEIAAKLASGEAFSELVKVYSEDLGSKGTGGNLGELIPDAYPGEFVDAAQALAVGSVSEAVKTEAGVHFIKLLDKTNVEAPSFDERKDALKRQLSLNSAQEVYTKKLDVLGDTTFNSDALSQAADALSLSVQTSKPFGRNGFSGIASSPEVVTAAYAKDVLLEGRNSRVIELPGDTALVLRLKTHAPEAVKDYVLVKTEIKYQLKSDKENELLEAKALELKDRVVQGASAEVLAKELSYEYKYNENALRTDFDLGGDVVRKVFSLPRPFDAATPVLESMRTQDGYTLVGLSAVKDGVISDLEEEQLAALKGQLGYQLGQLELTAFENAIVGKASISLPQ